MNTPQEANSPKTAEKSPPPTEGPQAPQALSPAEEPIILNKLFQETGRDIDALFPDPTLKRLLRDIVRTRQKNDRFLKGLAHNHLPLEPDADKSA